MENSNFIFCHSRLYQFIIGLLKMFYSVGKVNALTVRLFQSFIEGGIIKFLTFFEFQC